jgi:stage V sporulation protein G
MNRIQVTSVSVKPYHCSDPRLKAFATIVLNNDFAVKELKIIERSDGMFVAMPNCRGRDGLFHDLAHPLDQETRDIVHSAVGEAYHAEVTGASATADNRVAPIQEDSSRAPGIEVTHVAIRPHTNSDPKLQGFATIILNGAFVVKDIRIIHGRPGWFIAMPSRKRRDGQFHDVAHPLRQSVRSMIEDRVLSEFAAQIAGLHAKAQIVESLTAELRLRDTERIRRQIG